jgi:hypothetical protein
MTRAKVSDELATATPHVPNDPEQRARRTERSR